MFYIAQTSSFGIEEETLPEAQGTGRHLCEIVGATQEGIEGAQTGGIEEASFCQHARQQIQQSEFAEMSREFSIMFIY